MKIKHIGFGIAFLAVATFFMPVVSAATTTTTTTKKTYEMSPEEAKQTVRSTVKPNPKKNKSTIFVKATKKVKAKKTITTKATTATTATK